MSEQLEQNIKQIISKFDISEGKRFTEHEINSALKSLTPEKNIEIDSNLLAELMAFDFSENYQDKKTGWGTYFGPMMVWGNNDGTATESPSIQRVTTEMLAYWEKRANESQNPVIKARYAGLVWDFSKRISDTSPTYDIGKLYIESLIEIAEKDSHKYESDTVQKLKRALTLAISFNNEQLVNRATEAILKYEKKVSTDSKPGLWGFSFDLLVMNPKVSLDIKTEKEIIDGLEQKLARLSNPEIQKVDPWAAEAAAKRLGNYYRKKSKTEETNRVILQVGKAYDYIIDEASAFQASGWLEQLHNLYQQFGLTKEAEQILIKLRALGSKVNDELKPISHSFELPKEKIEEYVNQVVDGDIQTVLTRIAVRYIPIKEQVKEQIFDLSKNAPLQYLITHKLQDRKGRVVASIGSLETDLEGHIVRQVSQNLSFSSIFLRMIVERTKETFQLGAAMIIEFLRQSPVISEDKKEIIERGIESYLEGNHVASIHILIPQIEDTVRNIVEMAGGNVLKPSKNGGFHLRTFDEILRDDMVTNALGEDFTMYFRILFTDQRGWNLRNGVCHGAIPANAFNQQNADRIFHALLCIGLIRKSN